MIEAPCFMRKASIKPKEYRKSALKVYEYNPLKTSETLINLIK
jgi:hypothetical protein